MTEAVNVTQADIDLAVKILEAASLDGVVCCHDLEVTQEAIAQYRIEATRQAEADKAELVEALDALHKRYVMAIGNEGPEAIRAGLLVAKHGGRDAGTDNAG